MKSLIRRNASAHRWSAATRWVPVGMLALAVAACSSEEGAEPEEVAAEETLPGGERHLFHVLQQGQPLLVGEEGHHVHVLEHLFTPEVAVETVADANDKIAVVAALLLGQ